MAAASLWRASSVAAFGRPAGARTRSAVLISILSLFMYTASGTRVVFAFECHPDGRGGTEGPDPPAGFACAPFGFQTGTHR